jgi:16S rRNA (guanine527-N7)-methyltransferase
MFHVEQVVERLVVGAKALEINLDRGAAEGMALQLEMLHRWNAKLNLVGPGDPLDWASRHSIDSLVALAAIPQGSRVLDVGSGGGFPGIPLALMRADSRFWLAERRQKRRAFLQNVVAATRLSNVWVVTAPESEQPYDVVLGRAVLPTAAWLSYAASRCRTQGLVGLFAQESAGDPVALASSLGLEPAGDRRYELPGEAQRHFWWFVNTVPRETPRTS